MRADATFVDIIVIIIIQLKTWADRLRMSCSDMTSKSHGGEWVHGLERKTKSYWNSCRNSGPAGRASAKVNKLSQNIYSCVDSAILLTLLLLNPYEF
jgi:hypothetical protein